MEKKEKTSPLPGTNIFDPATLLGASPFSPGFAALPFAHLAQFPSAFSMLGHPAFPVSSLFGHLGADGITNPLGIPSSLASSLSPTSGPGLPSFDSVLSPLLLSMGQGGPMSDPLTLLSSPATTHDLSAKYGLFDPSGSAFFGHTSSTDMPSTSKRGGGRGSRGGSGGRGRTGSRGRPRKMGTKQPAIPLSLVQSTSILSPSQLEKFVRKRESNGTNGLDSDAHSDRSSVSSLFDFNPDRDHKTKDKKISPKMTSPIRTLTSPPRNSSSSPPRKSASKTPTSTATTNHAISLQDKVHIDSLKKKILADQIRQRVQRNAESPPATGVTTNSLPSVSRRKGRGRGRPPKISNDFMASRDLELKQDRLKAELEHELKQQEMTLKMMQQTNAALRNSTENSPTQSRNKGSPHSRSRNSPDKEPLLLNLSKSRSPEAYKSEQTSNQTCEPSTSLEDMDFGTSLLDKLTVMSRDKLTATSHDTSSNVSSMDDTNTSDNGSSSDSDSDSSSGSSDNDDGNNDGSSPGKRKADDQEGSSNERTIKRRHVVLDDSKIRIPLELGWKRQTNIHTYGRRGIVGEVWYFTPDGRKIKTIPDVMRYIERNNVTNLGRDQFSFNTKVNVGDFYEARIKDGENGFVKLSESEIKDRLSVTVSRRMKKIENEKKREKLKLQQIMARQMVDNKLKQKQEQQDMARKVAEMQFQKRVEREQQKELLRRTKQYKLLENKKQKDQLRLLRDQEKQQREDQLRMRREMRAHQMLEKQHKKQEELRQKKYIKSLKRAEEREMKRQQAAMLKEQMRLKQDQERRRQHMLLLKALEQRKKQEVRDKQREEKINERRVTKERKNEQRRMEFVLAQELKKPREDMELRDARVLPELPRLTGCLVDGDTLADCLMCLEFLHNFGKALGFDADTLPTLKSLQDAVLCKTEEDGEEYISLVTHLLRYALDDPGVPNPKEAVTKLNQKIVDLEVTDAVMPEVLRVFMIARNGGETDLSEYLRNYTLEACKYKQRAGVLTFLCNELNCSKNITSEIESHLDSMADIRRDKWVIEGKLRRLRTLRAKKFHHSISRPQEGEVGGDMDDTLMTSISKQNSDDEEENQDGSGNEDDSFTEGEAEDDPTTLEELEKQMEKLQKTHAQYRDKVFEKSHHVRAIDLGQDRYKRTYWILPHAGGVFVEGLESGAQKPLSHVNVKGDSENKNVKLELIGERTERKGSIKLLDEITEKKGVELLDEIEEKKAVEMKCENKKIKMEVKVEVNVKPLQGVKVSDLNGFVENGEKVSIDKSACENDATKATNENKTENVMLNGYKDDSTPDKVNGELDSIKKTDGLLYSDHKVLNGNVFSKETVVMNGTVDIDVDINNKPPLCVQTSGNHSESVKSPTKLVELKIPNIKTSAIETDKADLFSSNLFLHVPTSTKLTEFCNRSINQAIKTGTPEQHNHQSESSTSSSVLNTSSSDHVTKSTNHIASLPTPPRPPPAHSNSSKQMDRKPSFMSIDSILEKKTDSSQSNHFFPGGSALPVNPFTNQSRKSMSPDSHVIDNKPWFSILPRVPCDDMSLTRGQHSSIPSSMFLSSPLLTQLPFHPFPLQSPTFTSFQMGQLYGNPGDQNTSASLNNTNIVNHGDDSFKKPEVPACNTSQNAVSEDVLKTLQGEAKPILEEYKEGWWKIGDPEQLQTVQKCLHPRGIREKDLQKTIQKFYDYAIQSCTKAKKEVLCLESSSEEEEESSEEEEEEEEEIKGADSYGNDGKKDEHEIAENGEKMETDETFETKVDNTDNRMGDISDAIETTATGLDIETTSKPDEVVKTEEKAEVKKEKKRKQKKVGVAPVIDCKARTDEADRGVLEEVETLEDRIANASLQIKGWKLAPKTYLEESEIRIINRGEPKADDNDMYPIEASKERLLQLESNIERRYLKPPLCKTQRISLSSLSTSHNEALDEGGDTEVDFESLPIGLQTWRIAVATATSPAQLMLCIIQLNKSIAWEKSIMKVLCQICRKDDNEAELLLCDGCDRGYHTYCFKPKMENVPEGDWYCFECISKAAGETCCLVCGRRLGRMAECSRCNRCVHIDCVDPPLPRVPRKWFCATCEDTKAFKKRVRKNSTAGSVTPIVTPTVQPPPVAPLTPITPTADLTPTGRKRRCDFGVPRKRKTSDNISEGDSPQKKEKEVEKDERQMDKLMDKQMDKQDIKAERAAERQTEKERLKQKEQSSDMGICRALHTEMMKHEDGWPFLQPVNCKHFPSYRKYIKSPMDFGSMKIKLRDHVYTRRSEFVTDAHLVFDNCKLFNEDDSEVGQCGHNMKKYFKRRWKEVLLETADDT